MEIKFNQDTLNRLNRAYKSALLDTAKKFVECIKAKVKEEDGSDTGELVNSIWVREKGDLVQVGSNAVQAVIMEFGRRPLQKRPPVQALTPWLKRKWIIKGGKYEDLSSKEKGVVYVMARSIGKEGIRPRRYFSKARYEHKDELQGYFMQRFYFYFWVWWLR